MAIDSGLLLERMATKLRHDVGPVVSDEFARTQVFMASVILAKLSAQLRQEAADLAAARHEHADVAAAVSHVVADRCGEVRVLAAGLARDGSEARWSALIVSLYTHREALGNDRFDAALGIVRRAIRARLDRALEYAR